MTNKKDISIIDKHPCFSVDAHHKYSRIHLPVAPVCNIKCKYCTRKFDCANESRPGVTSKVMTPHEAVDRLRLLSAREDNLSVVGIAGPGEPLANKTTFDTLNMIRDEFPDLQLCASTNGLMLPYCIDELTKAGVQTLTVTINAVNLDVAAKIYSWIIWEGKALSNNRGIRILVENNWMGLELAVNAGMFVKVNTVCIPGVNDGAEIISIAKKASALGAHIMNIIPLIPNADFNEKEKPSSKKISHLRKECSAFIKQMSHCRQCRADAFGNLCEDKDMELEALYSTIGLQYCESIF
ncbi:nitrogenase cofactor biosynthesis protein NifB [Candidatus Magnetoovum chiemensis]|nr:nitrogenase cofactor biosynthesis protein NifB [Candidatus Magnetoovum chiemensis]